MTGGLTSTGPSARRAGCATWENRGIEVRAGNKIIHRVAKTYPMFRAIIRRTVPAPGAPG
ncbi:MAG: hypothetical protein CL397_15160 [Acidiferrobacteraceae bacterium]|nr:hypothetical protein [Acidiferrobacteraceae bacterium]